MRTMKIVHMDSGFTLSFGWDPIKRKPAWDTVFWDDMEGNWESTTSNCAGSCNLRFAISPDFIMDNGNLVVAYQPGICVEFHRDGMPYIWGIKVLRASQG